jgi:hypothetical protein
MRRVWGGDSDECALRSSLSAIRQAQEGLHVLTGLGTTATVLVWQIELCDVLLVEISSIRSGLAKDLNPIRKASRRDCQIGLNG